MQFMASEIARVTGGRLVGDDVLVSASTFDSRNISNDELFIAVRAERDGHDFIATAIANGAVAYLTEGPTEPGATAVVVDNTRAALYELARAARARLTEPVVGITGSNGKTSTKEMLRSIFGVAGKVNATQGSFNNELGLPITLINAEHEDAPTILEMGARGVGQIAELCSIATPDIGIVTNVGTAHIGEFGSQEAIARTKGELIEAAKHTAVINLDDSLVAAMRSRAKANVVTYGLRNTDVTAINDIADELDRHSFDLVTLGGSRHVQLSLSGQHQVINALGCTAVALAAGISLGDIVRGLEAAQPASGRMQLVHLENGAVLINDAYNANPVSMEAALNSLARMSRSGRRIAVLGYMAELGEVSSSEHRRIAELAKQLNIELIAFETDEYGTQPIADVESVVRSLATITDQDAVLLKASRVARLERIAERLSSQA